MSIWTRVKAEFNLEGLDWDDIGWASELADEWCNVTESPNDEDFTPIFHIVKNTDGCRVSIDYNLDNNGDLGEVRRWAHYFIKARAEEGWDITGKARFKWDSMDTWEVVKTDGYDIHECTEKVVDNDDDWPDRPKKNWKRLVKIMKKSDRRWDK